jgi:hypothetical protein
LTVIGEATKFVYATPSRVKCACSRTAGKLSLVTVPSEVVTAELAVTVTPPELPDQVLLQAATPAPAGSRPPSAPPPPTPTPD